jgi:hypothetical protein
VRESSQPNTIQKVLRWTKPLHKAEKTYEAHKEKGVLGRSQVLTAGAFDAETKTLAWLLDLRSCSSIVQARRFGLLSWSAPKGDQFKRRVFSWTVISDVPRGPCM